jgi:hypothetical protein
VIAALTLRAATATFSHTPPCPTSCHSSTAIELDCTGAPAFFFIISSMASPSIILPKVQVQVEEDHNTGTVAVFHASLR